MRMWKRPVPILLLAFLLTIPTACAAKRYECREAWHMTVVGKSAAHVVRPVPVIVIAETEWEAVLLAVAWAIRRYNYEDTIETVPVWISSDEMFYSLKGVCIDWSILLVALLRFGIRPNVPAERVWVYKFLPKDSIWFHAIVEYESSEGQTYWIGLTSFDPLIMMEPPARMDGPAFAFNDLYYRVTE